MLGISFVPRIYLVVIVLYLFDDYAVEVKAQVESEGKSEMNRSRATEDMFDIWNLTP